MDYKIEIPIFEWKNQTFIRSSIHVYNEKKDIDYWDFDFDTGARKNIWAGKITN